MNCSFHELGTEIMPNVMQMQYTLQSIKLDILCNQQDFSDVNYEISN